MKRLSVLLGVLLMVIGLALSSNAALVDMNDGTIYDTDTQLSWLKDVNYAMTSGYDADGRMTWAASVAWAASLNDSGGFAGLTGWRLPNADLSCYGYNCINSEMGHLYYAELGSTAGGPLNNTGPFTNLQENFYWSRTPYSPTPGHALYLGFMNGSQGGGEMASSTFAWAVTSARATPSPVGYNPAWLVITLISLTLIGGYLLRRRMAR